MLETDTPVKMHHCRICMKGFASGSALGGHVRSHGINEAQEPVSNKHTYNLRASRSGNYGDYNYDYASRGEEEEVEEDLVANCLVMLSNNFFDRFSCKEGFNSIKIDHKKKEVERDLSFQCKGCKMVFNSHQALGGHRASHKKVKGCFATRKDRDTNKEDDKVNLGEFLANLDHHSSRRNPKVHECSICNRVFSSGQALGGHKRCHWLTSYSTDKDSTTTNSSLDFHELEQFYKKPKFQNSDPLDLSLNLQAEYVYDEAEIKKKKAAELRDLRQMSLGGGFSSWLQVGIVSSTSTDGGIPPDV